MTYFMYFTFRSYLFTYNRELWNIMRIMFLYLLAISLFLSGAQCSEFYACSFIVGPDVDCNVFPINETCGDDLVTYKNKCFFSQAHCKDTSLDLLHHGACSSQDLPTTTVNPIRGQAIVQAVFCTRLSHIDCPDTYDPVCGTNGRTYKNTCEYEKGKCTHLTLHVQKFGDCDA